MTPAKKRNSYKEYAPILLRLGIALVFLWFGVNQLANPAGFVGYLPDWAMQHPMNAMHQHHLQMMHAFPGGNADLVRVNGAIETVFGLMMLAGLFVRLSAVVLGVHLFLVMIGLGYNDVAVRDFGLLLTLVAVFLFGADKWSIDWRIGRKNSFVRFFLPG